MLFKGVDGKRLIEQLKDCALYPREVYFVHMCNQIFCLTQNAHLDLYRQHLVWGPEGPFCHTKAWSSKLKGVLFLNGSAGKHN